MSRRLERVNSLLREMLSTLVARDVRDPRLHSLLSVTIVETSADLQHAKVFVSIMGSPQEQSRALTGLTSAAGFLRRQLRPMLPFKRVPLLTFHLDESIQRGQKLLDLMEVAVKGEEIGGSTQ